MRQELTNKLIMVFSNYDIDRVEISNKICIILNDYEVCARTTEIAIRSEEKNKLFLQKFLIAKSVSGRSARTIDYYKKTLINALERINKCADEITTDDIRYYLAIRQNVDKITKTTANNELRVLKSFYGFLLTEDIVTKNPCLKIEQIKQSKNQKPALSELDVERIRNACGTNRELAIVEILLSTGCRVTELVNIKIADIKTDKLVVHGKGDKDRTVYLNARAIVSIEKYLAERHDSNPYLFCGGLYNKLKNYNSKKGMWYMDPDLVGTSHTDKSTIESTMRRLGKKAGVKKVHPHRFRRTCATFALRRGMPIEQVSKMLGHESVDTTMVYLDLTEEDLHQAHKKYVV